MFVSGKRKSALQTMATLARHYPELPMNVSDLSDVQGQSVSYIEQLFAHLKRAHLVQGIRGPGGGYMLTRKPNQISLAEILEAFPKEETGFEKFDNEMRNVLHKFTLERLIS
jgi:Rrf2 family iron-sulfur cluster assembly transcriptional regulator